jgi:hypothetical protein
MSAPPKPLTMLFWPESAYGPTNQRIGLADILPGFAFGAVLPQATASSRQIPCGVFGAWAVSM